MALAVLDAKRILAAASIPGIDGIYTVSIPTEITSNPDKTYVLITDANTNTDNYGSGDFHTLRRMVEVQLFFKADLDFDPEAVTVACYRAFVRQHWQLGENRGYLEDPDTNQLYTTFYVTDYKAV